jgi:geranylgeranyl diphosphate synthase type I
LNATNIGGAPTEFTSATEFENEIEPRRRLVYDYLDSWRGAELFRPEEIHDAIYSYVSRRGKALRPVVLMLACGAVGGDEAVALPAAAAVEVFHTWTLVHDDIIDRDETRRGKPTVHAEQSARGRAVFGVGDEEAAHYGRAVAILAGDSQQSWSYALLTQLRLSGVRAELVVDLVERMARWLTPALLEGEMLDVDYALSAPESVSEDQILTMLTRKTGALLEYSAWCGARIGLAGTSLPLDWADRLGRFASLCGTAFQLHDDVLGLTADEKALGKPVGSDLREGKRTLIVHRALPRLSEGEKDTLLSVLGNTHARHEEIEAALEAIRSSDALEEVSELANSYITQARELLSGLPDTRQRALLDVWARYLLARRH